MSLDPPLTQVSADVFKKSKIMGKIKEDKKGYYNLV